MEQEEGLRADAGASVLRGGGRWGEALEEVTEAASLQTQLRGGEKGRGWPWSDVQGIFCWIFTPPVVIHLRGTTRGLEGVGQWLWAGELRGPVAVECRCRVGHRGSEPWISRKPRSHRASHTQVPYATLTSPTCSHPLVQHRPSREWVSGGLRSASLRVCVNSDLSRPPE